MHLNRINCNAFRFQKPKKLTVKHLEKLTVMHLEKLTVIHLGFRLN